MLISASNSLATQSRKERKRLPATHQPDTRHSSINPFALPGSKAANPMYALLRLPELGTGKDSIINAATWASVECRKMPTKPELLNAIHVANLSGQLTPDRARWLADNRSAPIMLWTAIEHGMAYTDDASALRITGVDAYLQTLTLPELTRFIVDWANTTPHAIDSELLELLVAAKRHITGEAQSCELNASELEQSLRKTMDNISRHLNKTVAQPDQYREPTTLSAYEFVAGIEPSGAVLPTGQDMMGLELDSEFSSELPTATWKTMITAIELIGFHLHPITTPDSLMEFMYGELDEAEGELDEIHDYIKHHNLNVQCNTDIEQAIAAGSSCGHDFGYVCDYENYLYYGDRLASQEANKDTWTTSVNATLDNLKELIAALPIAIQSSNNEKAQEWLNTVRDTLIAVIETPAVDQIAQQQLAEYCIDATVQPIYIDNDLEAADHLQSIYEGMMNGDECEENMIGWHFSASTVIEMARRMGLGIRLLHDLVYLGGEKSCND